MAKAVIHYDKELPENKTMAIVSVMMLREGWDVKNVTVVLGLRPFTAKAEILPEQVIGRRRSHKCFGMKHLLGRVQSSGTEEEFRVWSIRFAPLGSGIV